MNGKPEIGGQRSEVGGSPDARKLSPAARAALDYAKHGSPDFLKHVREHFAGGHLYSTPAAFLMCKVVDLQLEAYPGPAWYVTYANGDLRALLAEIPFPCPWFAWRRFRHGREEIRVYPFERVVKLITK